MINCIVSLFLNEVTKNQFKAIDRKIEKELANWDEPFDAKALEGYCKLVRYTCKRGQESKSTKENLFWYERAKRYQVIIIKMAKKGGIKIES